MTRHGTPPSFEDKDFDRLEELLNDPALEESMRLDEIQGYLCAALAGIRPIDEADRLVEILGSEAAQESEAGREAVKLIRKLSLDLAASLAAGKPPILVLYPRDPENDDSPYDYSPWCQAYFAGVHQAAEDWFKGAGENATEEDLEDLANFLDERFFPIMVLAGESEAEAEAAAKERGEAWHKDKMRAQMEHDSKNDLPRAVTDIYRFWLSLRGAGTIRGGRPRTSRNPPCPCGSGRKFKQCCGRR